MRICLFPVLCFAAFSAMAAPPLLTQDFEQDDTGWVVFGGDGKIQVTHDPALVKNGKGTMEFRYESSGTKPALAVLPVQKPLTGTKSLKLWVKSDADTAAAIALVEKDGGRYDANFWLEANTWQRVELTPDDFILATGPHDPKDPDGKLDLDQLQAIALLDASQLFATALGDAAAHIAVEDRSGTHTMWVDDFEVSSTTPAWYAPQPRFLIDGFRAPQVNWITMGGANLKIESGKTLRIDCKQMPDHFVIATHMLPPMDLKSATHIAFDIAADKPAHLVFVLQEKSDTSEGPRYHADVEVDGGGQPKHRELALSGFELDDNGPPDPDHKLDLDKLKMFSIVNVTGAYTGEDSINTIRIGKIEAVTHK